MARKRLLVAVVCLLALAAGNAQARDSDTIVTAPENLQFVGLSDACPFGILTFDLVSESEDGRGDGSACIQSIVGNCVEPPFTGCRQKVSSILTLNLTEGSVAFQTSIRERFLSEVDVHQQFKGHLIEGTGDFADLKGGRLRGEGVTNFEGLGTTVVFELRLKEGQDRDAD